MGFIPARANRVIVVNRLSESINLGKNQGSYIMISRQISKNKPARIFMIVTLISIIALLSACQTTPQWAPYDGDSSRVYPEKNWHMVQTPEQISWSSIKLAEAHAYSQKIGSAAVMIVDDGIVFVL